MPWIHAANTSELADLDVVGVRKDGHDLAVYKLDGEFFASDNICTHQFAHLSEGLVVDGCIECPLHQGMFDIRTGKAQGGVAKVDLKIYPTRVEGERIMVLVE